MLTECFEIPKLNKRNVTFASSDFLKILLTIITSLLLRIHVHCYVRG